MIRSLPLPTRQLISAVAVLVALTSATAGIYFLIQGPVLVSFPLFVVAISTTLAVALQAPATPVWVSPSPQISALLTFVCAALLVAIAITGRFTSGLSSLPDLYYILLIALCGAIAIKILVKPNWISLVLVWGLYLVTRATVWNHAARVGTDSLFHTAIIDYIRHSSELLPAGAHYYHSFPGGHLLAAAMGDVLGIGTRLAFFVSMSAAVCVSMGVIYIFSTRLFKDDRRVGLFAALLVATSANHYLLSSLLITQVLSFSFVPLLLYLFYRPVPPIRTVMLFFVFAGTILATHNLTPLVVVLLGCFVASTRLAISWGLADQASTKLSARPPLTLSVLIGGLMTYIWYLNANYFGFVVNRLLALVNIGTNVVSESSSPMGGGIPTTNLLGLNLPPILEMAGSPLIRGLLLGIVGWQLLYQLEDSDSPLRARFEYQLVSLLLFGLIASIFFAGLQSGVRALPVVVLVAAPACAHQLTRLVDTRGIAGAIIVVLLLSSSAYFMAANGNASATEGQVYKPLYTESEIAGVAFANTHTEQTYSDRWMMRLGKYNQWRDGTVNTDQIYEYIRSDEVKPGVFARYAADHLDEPFLYKTYYRMTGRPAPPPCYETLFTSGGAELQRPTVACTHH